MVKPDKKPEWFSTYAILTAERILERFHIQLSHQELTDILKNPESPYYHLLSVPLKNIFNGILMTQVHDYQVYAQKILIDYKLGSPDSGDDDNTSGTHAQEELEVKYVELIEYGAELEERKQQHQELISESQAWLIKETQNKQNLTEKFKNFHQNTELSEQMAAFGKRVENQMMELQNLRTMFRELILDINNLLVVVPDYFIDTDDMAKKREALDFNPELSDFSTSEEY
jgi:hypothetical protein